MKRPFIGLTAMFSTLGITPNVNSFSTDFEMFFFCTQNRSIVLTTVLPLRRFLAKIMERYFCNNKPTKFTEKMPFIFKS